MQKLKIARAVAAFLSILVASIHLEAADVSRSKTDKRREHIKKVEEYFNGIRTLEADFVQIDKHGRTSMGHFFLKRPYLMKMDYRDPPTRVIIAKNNKIIHYDRELKEKTETSTYSSPLSFLLEPQINLEQHVDVTSIHDGKDEFSLKFCRKDEEIEEAVLLVFSKNPLTLKEWILLSNKSDVLADGYTEVCLENHRFGHDISDKEFEKFEISD
ncbi:MAG: outer membrane lipoprotein carrier protein LolA [Holosporaceae bacterium]|nr:outer membrane lipoprotein carrier protein LolA [Holosporaceae bacterium]